MKLYCDEWFEGSIRNESIEVRAVWAALLAFAGRVGNGGVIRLPGCDIGFSDEQLAGVFNVPIELWISAKERLSNHPGGQEENRITVTDRNVIEIINWSKYQSEYLRIKGYKSTKKSTEINTRKSNGENRLDKNRLDLDLDLDLKKEEPTPAPPEGDAEYISRIRKFHNDFLEAEGAQLIDWRKVYGDALNVDACLLTAATWLIENPRNRKKNILRFYGNWLRNQYTRATQPRTVR